MNLRRSCISLFGICALALGAPMIGCVGSPDQADDQTGDEPVGEAESAFGESTCGADTMSPDVTLTNTWPQMIYAWHASSGLPYGNSSCTDAFRVLHQSYPYIGCTVQAKWSHDSSVTLPGTQTNCENSYVKVITYNASGTVIGSSTKYGVWQSAGACSLPGSFFNSATATASADGAQLAIAVSYVANCFTDPVSHRLICLHTQDGVQTLTSCP